MGDVLVIGEECRSGGLTTAPAGAVAQSGEVESLADAELRHVLVLLLHVHRRALRDELRKCPPVVRHIAADLRITLTALLTSIAAKLRRS